jgi:hypothetical protein
MLTPIVGHRRRARAVVLFATILLLSLTATAGWGQDEPQTRTSWFRVSWHWRPGALPSSIEGSVYNDSPFRVTDVRLQVEGLDTQNHHVGERLAWAIGDIVPGGDTAYVTETIPGAVDYRVTVVSFDLVARERGGPDAAAPSPQPIEHTD